MYNDNIIAKKVYRLISSKVGFLIDKSKTYTISAVKDYEEANDYCKHYVLTDKDGNEVEIREWECVFCPDKSRDEIPMIYKYLKDNGLYVDDIWDDGENIIISISWGDWKHDHLWLLDLMEYLGGYIYTGEYVTEEDGSDCYSAKHTFYKLK